MRPPGLVWPNEVAASSSDPWIAKNHYRLVRMSPRILVLNFANGTGQNGNDILMDARRPTERELHLKVEAFVEHLRQASTPRAGGSPFLQPVIVGVINMSDDSPHVNSRSFPRGQLNESTGYHTVGVLQAVRTGVRRRHRPWCGIGRSYTTVPRPKCAARPRARRGDDCQPSGWPTSEPSGGSDRAHSGGGFLGASLRQWQDNPSVMRSSRMEFAPSVSGWRTGALLTTTRCHGALFAAAFGSTF